MLKLNVGISAGARRIAPRCNGRHSPKIKAPELLRTLKLSMYAGRIKHQRKWIVGRILRHISNFPSLQRGPAFLASLHIPAWRKLVHLPNRAYPNRVAPPRGYEGCDYARRRVLRLLRVQIGNPHNHDISW